MSCTTENMTLWPNHKGNLEPQEFHFHLDCKENTQTNTKSTREKGFKNGFNSLGGYFLSFISFFSRKKNVLKNHFEVYQVTS